MSNSLKPEIIVPATIQVEAKQIEQESPQPNPHKRRKRRRSRSRSCSGSGDEQMGSANQLPPLLSSHLSSHATSTSPSPQNSPSSLSPMVPSLNLDTEHSFEGSGSNQQARDKARSKARRKKSKSRSTQGSPLASPTVPMIQLNPNTHSEPSPLSDSVISLNADPSPETLVDWAENRRSRNRARNAERKSKLNELRRARSLILFACEGVDEDLIQTWSDEEVLEKAKDIEGEILTETGDESIWLVDLDQREKARTPDTTFYEDKEPDLSKEKLESERWTILNRGTIYGFRTINQEKVLVFAARFCPYSQMSPEELDDFQFLAQHFHKLGKLFYPVTTNGAMTGGIMFAEGWRVAYEALFSMGLYKMMRKQNSENTPEEYAAFLDEMERASAIYAKRYKKLAPREYLRSLGFMEESCVPCFGTTEPESRVETSFGSNLTVTWGDFRNRYHKDKDAQPRAAGSWFVTTDEGKLVTDPDEIHNAVEGGYFALPTFKFAIDFSKCPGVVDLMWSSEDDLHATSQSVTAPGFRRIGSSIQVPKRVADAAARMADTPINQQPIAGKAIRILELAHEI